MKSIRSKIITVVIMAVLITTVIITAISINAINVQSNQDSDLLLEYVCKQNAAYANGNLDSTEQALNSIYYYAVEQLENDAELFFSDEAYRQGFLESIEEMALTECANTSDVQSIYFRVNTDIDPTGGFLYQYYDGTGRLEKRIIKEIDRGGGDGSYTRWYHDPIEAGEMIWIGPYDNYELKMRAITCAAPVYANDRLIGVLGMDIDISVMSRDLGRIRLYQSGSAMLFDKEDNLIFHKSHVRGLSRDKFSAEQEAILEAAKVSAAQETTCSYNGQTKLYAMYLSDGMLLCVLAPLEEINETQSVATRHSLELSIIILLIVITVTSLVIGGFLRPLKDLSHAARELSNGNMEVSIDKYKGEDEVTELAETFSVMADSLKRYFDHFHSLAYTDNLTGLNNKAAFETTRGVIESEIQMGRASFTIVVMDVNNLKLINDSIGHEKGDVLLKHTALCMRKAFTGFPLYRIGGDEFVSIINESADPKELIRNLQEITAASSNDDYEDFKVHYQIAAGSSDYSREDNDSFADVFNRADKAMYENKKMLKGIQT